MKTKSRFDAAITGVVQSVQGGIRRHLVETTLKTNELENEAKLLALDSEKNELVKKIAVGESKDLRANLQAMADLLQREEALKATRDMSAKILAVLDEKIEVEESK